MHAQIHECPGLTTGDIEFLESIERSMQLAADISRADVLLCTRLSSTQGVIVEHVMPDSISSLYRTEATGRDFTIDEQPLIFRAIEQNRYGRRQRNVLKDGAPVIQEVHPICNAGGRTIAALVFETNMIAHERHKRRNRYFREALKWFQAMCIRGDLNNVKGPTLSRFGQYDGVYLVDSKHSVVYMSGSASNMFRTIGLPTNLIRQPLNTLEAVDLQLVAETFASDLCHELRTESGDGRTWVRKTIPVHGPKSWRWARLLGLSPLEPNRSGDEYGVDAVMVLLHNATEAVAKQRELEVKSAIIQEVHHRIKNNLQNVAAILRLQLRRSSSEETKQHLADAINRVLSMSVIHEFLSHDEHNPINVRDVCQRIAGQVVEVSRSPAQQIDVRVQGPTIRLPASQATPIALVLNELLMNAIEHGVGDRSQASIKVILSDLGDAVRMTVEDDGQGLADDFDLRKSNSLGLQIVTTLVSNDLKGSIEIASISEILPVSSSISSSVSPPVPSTKSTQDELGATKTTDNSVSEATLASRKLGTRAIVTFPKRPLNVD